jgi:hypothetical protein
MAVSRYPQAPILRYQHKPGSPGLAHREDLYQWLKDLEEEADRNAILKPLELIAPDPNRATSETPPRPMTVFLMYRRNFIASVGGKDDLKETTAQAAIAYRNESTEALKYYYKVYEFATELHRCTYHGRKGTPKPAKLSAKAPHKKCMGKFRVQKVKNRRPAGERRRAPDTEICVEDLEACSVTSEIDFTVVNDHMYF